MKFRLIVPIISSLFLVPSVFGSNGDQLVDRVAAVVNKEVITQSEVDVIFFPIYQQIAKAYQGPNLEEELRNARLRLLNQIIEDKLVYQEAQKLGVKVTDEEIQEELERFRSQFKNPEEFNREIEKSGLKMSEFEQRIKERLAIMKLHEYEIRGKVTLLPAEVEQYFQKHPEEFSQKEQVKLWGMTLRKNEEAIAKGLTDEPAKRKAEDLAAQLKKGADFEALAKKESQDPRAGEGGSMGMVEKGDMIENIDQVIFSLPEGSISDVLETEEGYHIFKVGAKTPASQKTFEEAKEEIREKLFRKKAHERFVSWMDELKKKAYISIR